MRRRRWPVLGLLALLAWACLGRPAAGAVDPTLSGREVVDRALAALQARNEGSVQLQPVFVPADMPLPVAQVRWQVKVLAPLEASTPRVQLTALAGQDALQTWVVAFRKLPVRECLVVRRALRQGETLSPGMFERVCRPVSPGMTPVSDPCELQDCAARRSLEVGDILQRHHLVELPVVELGEAVTVTFTSGRITGTVAAWATQRGYRGRPFRVQTRTHQPMTVWLHPDGTVRTSRPGAEAPLALSREEGKEH